LALRCLPALAVVPSPDVIKVFLVPADNMPGHKKMSELLSILNICIFEADDGQDTANITVLPSFQ